MSKSVPKRIVFIGAGNLATRLALELKRNNFNIIQVYSRTIESAKLLSEKISTSFTNNLNDIIIDADLYFIAVSDNAIKDILQKINFNNKLIVHTSGSIAIEILKKYSDNYGVFYPLQTFSKTRDINFNFVPVCIEANNTENISILNELAKQISEKVYEINSEQRKYLHLAAVFSCNFVNHLYSLSDNILDKKNIPFEILKPLIIETANKIIDNKPHDVQTGPAIRKDKNVIDEHLKLLSDFPEIKEIYKILSNNIINFNNSSQTLKKKVDN